MVILTADVNNLGFSKHVKLYDRVRNLVHSVMCPELRNDKELDMDHGNFRSLVYGWEAGYLILVKCNVRSRKL